MRRTTVLLASLALTATLGLAACSDDSSTDSTSTPPATNASTPSAPASSGSSGDTSLPEVKGAVGETPQVAKPEGEPPTEIVSDDIVEGDGAEATAGSNVTVDYHLVKWSDGSVVESSFESGQPATFDLAGLIQCWQEGIPGMKEGGRRLLVCPPETAYGTDSAAHPLGGQTLLFVIDLKSVNAS